MTGINKFSVLLFLLVCMLPINIFSWDIYSNLVRDNVNYFSFYNVAVNSMYESYIEYKLRVGASEPIYFIYSHLCKIFGVSYEYSILLINVVFIVSLYAFMIKFCTSSIKVLAFGIFLGGNYYIFVLFSELHRLSLAYSFIILTMVFSSEKKKLWVYLLSVLTHFQMLFLFPLYIKSRASGVERLLILMASSLCFIFWDALLGKFTYYYTLSLSRGYIFDVFGTMLLILSMSIVFYYFKGRLSREVIAFLFLILVGVAVFGSSRLNIMVYLFFFFALFESIRLRKNEDVLLLFSFLLIWFVYDSSKIYMQYEYLMRWEASGA